MLWFAPGANSRSREIAAPPRLALRATRTMRAPIFARVSAATWPMPDVPPVITTVFPCMVVRQCNLIGDANRTGLSPDVASGGLSKEGRAENRGSRSVSREVPNIAGRFCCGGAPRLGAARRGPFPRIASDALLRPEPLLSGGARVHRAIRCASRLQRPREVARVFHRGRSSTAKEFARNTGVRDVRRRHKGHRNLHQSG